MNAEPTNPPPESLPFAKCEYCGKEYTSDELRERHKSFLTRTCCGDYVTTRLESPPPATLPPATVESATPETDAVISANPDIALHCVPADFARKLETERDSARAETKLAWEAHGKMFNQLATETGDMRRDKELLAHHLSTATAENSRLRELLLSLEWQFDADLERSYCPVCQNPQSLGHTTECNFAAALTAKTP